MIFSQLSHINKNDIVSFYDGGNDAFLSYIYENMDDNPNNKVHKISDNHYWFI